MKARQQVTATGDFPAAPWLARDIARDIPARDDAWAELWNTCDRDATARGMRLLWTEGAADRSLLYLKTTGDGEPKRVECSRAEAEFVRLRLSAWAVQDL